MHEPPDMPVSEDRTSASGTDDDLLRRELAARYGHLPLVPPRVDDAVLEQARSHFAAIGRRQRWQSWRMVGTSIAAAALLAVSAWFIGLLPWPATTPPAVPSRMASLPGDVNGDGVVDVLDLLLLARKLETGREPPPQADLTGDGRVTFDDVHALGRQIVALEPAGQEPRL